MNKKNIIIAGYPKSGTTWLARLVGELVDCPIVGFWQQAIGYPEIAMEGANRSSEWQVWKAHHQECNLNLAKIDNKIIYIIRDPRDVAISGSHYFNKSIPKMIDSILYGKKGVCIWTNVSWANHYLSYLQVKRGNFIYIRYEDLLNDIGKECSSILDYLGLVRNDEHITQAIINQSFEVKKKGFIASEKKGHANFMRKGYNDQWRTILDEVQKNLFVSELSNELKYWNYSLE